MEMQGSGKVKDFDLTCPLTLKGPLAPDLLASNL